MHATDVHPARVRKIERTMKPYTEIPRSESARKFTSEFIEAVREQSSIESVAREYVELRKSGAQLVGLCPFHAERTPSFYVNPAKGAFFCHGCGAHGDVFDFTKRVLRCEFRQAVHYLAARAGFSREGFTPTLQLRQRVALLTAHQHEERRFHEFCNRRIDVINAKYRALARAATHAERCLRTGALSPEEEAMAWASLERYRAFAARVEREELCELDSLRREWRAQKGQEVRHAA
jgi:DNA primase